MYYFDQRRQNRLKGFNLINEQNEQLHENRAWIGHFAQMIKASDIQ